MNLNNKTYIKICFSLNLNVRVRLLWFSQLSILRVKS